MSSKYLIRRDRKLQACKHEFINYPTIDMGGFVQICRKCRKTK